MLQDYSKNFKYLMEKSKEIKHILPYANLLCRLALNLPLAVVLNERTFSKLKLVKTFFRSTINYDRLNFLVLLRIEKDIVDELDINKLVQQWSKLKDYILKYFIKISLTVIFFLCNCFLI